MHGPLFDDLERLRSRGDDRGARPELQAPCTPAFVGRVVSSSNGVAAQHFVKVNPWRTALGTESEGSSGSADVDTGTTHLVYLLDGTAATGDDLLCHFVPWRWVGRKKTATTGGGISNCQNCFGVSVPFTLFLTDPYGTITLTNPGFGFTWQGTASRTGAAVRDAGCANPGAGTASIKFVLTCQLTNWQLAISHHECTIGLNTWLNTGTPATAYVNLNATGCPPGLSLSFTQNFAGSPYATSGVYTGSTTFTVTQ